MDTETHQYTIDIFLQEMLIPIENYHIASLTEKMKMVELYQQTILTFTYIDIANYYLQK